MPGDVCNMSENNGKEAIIECVCRIYRVQMPGGMIADVESTKPLSVQMTHELLEEDKEIDEFFAHHKITGMRHMITSQETHVKETRAKEGKATEKLIFDQGGLTPRQRINYLLKMKGEFTREDYQKHMLDVHRIKIPKFMAHDDIRKTLSIKRLERVSGKPGRVQWYKVVDPVEMDEQLYKTVVKDHKLHMGIVQ